MFSLDGEIAFVTGAGSGIGQRIAIGLAEAGADVACFDLRGSAGLARDGRARSTALGRRAVALGGDVTDEPATGRRRSRGRGATLGPARRSPSTAPASPTRRRPRRCRSSNGSA